jgi:hypothetical protein
MMRIAAGPIIPRPRRAYGIALVLIVAVLGGAFLTLSVLGLSHVNARHARVSDRRAARSVVEGAVDRLALDAATWMAGDSLDRSWSVAGFEVTARLVPVMSPAALVSDDSIAYRGLEISARPIDYGDGEGAAATAARRRGRLHQWGLVRRYNVAAALGQPPMFALVAESTLERSAPRNADRSREDDTTPAAAPAPNTEE